MEIEKEFLIAQLPSINQYESLTESAYSAIRKQQYVIDNKSCGLFLFSLEDLHKKFFGIPNDALYDVCPNMPASSLLFRMSTCLPQELIKKICFLMMDGENPSNFMTHKQEKEWREKIAYAAELLYSAPIGQAFDRYYTIATWLTNKKLPIGPLYIVSQDEQNQLLSIKPSLFSIPVIDKPQKDKIDELTDLKSLYLYDQEVMVLETDKSLQCDLCSHAILLAVGPTFFGTATSIGACIGACSGDVMCCISSKPFLAIIGGASGVWCCISSLTSCYLITNCLLGSKSIKL
jgi:hypothetical protein